VYIAISTTVERWHRYKFTLWKNALYALHSHFRTSVTERITHNLICHRETALRSTLFRNIAVRTKGHIKF